MEFEPLDMGAQVKDETVEFIQSINQTATDFVKQIYVGIQH